MYSEDHVFRKSVEGGADGVRAASGAEGTDRQRGDGSGVQGDHQATALLLGDEVEGSGSGGGIESAVLELHTGALGSVLAEDQSMGIPSGCLTYWPNSTIIDIIRRSHPICRTFPLVDHVAGYEHPETDPRNKFVAPSACAPQEQRLRPRDRSRGGASHEPGSFCPPWADVSH